MNALFAIGLIVFVAIVEFIYYLALRDLSKSERKEQWWFFLITSILMASLVFMILIVITSLVREAVRNISPSWIFEATMGLSILIFFILINRTVART